MSGVDATETGPAPSGPVICDRSRSPNLISPKAVGVPPPARPHLRCFQGWLTIWLQSFKKEKALTTEPGGGGGSGTRRTRRAPAIRGRAAENERNFIIQVLFSFFFSFFFCLARQSQRSLQQASWSYSCFKGIHSLYTVVLFK